MIFCFYLCFMSGSRFVCHFYLEISLPIPVDLCLLTIVLSVASSFLEDDSIVIKPRGLTLDLDFFIIV